jgi:hypothetical protein
VGHESFRFAMNQANSGAQAQVKYALANEKARCPRNRAPAFNFQAGLVYGWSGRGLCGAAPVPVAVARE